MVNSNNSTGQPDVKYTEQDVLDYHSNNFPGNGKIEIISKTPVTNQRDLTLAYSPGVADACQAIQANPMDLYKYTNIGNTVAVITNGTRVLGLGDIGMAGYPVMEGKSILFKALGSVDAFPLVINRHNKEEFIEVVKTIAPNFGGINLEDIQKPDCFYIERTLDAALDIPVFHDDQWGTAVVTLAGVINSLKLVGKKFSDIKVAVNGSGASGIAISHMLLDAGVKGSNLNSVDRNGAIFTGRDNMDEYKDELSQRINPNKESLSLAEATEGCDLLIGASGPGLFTQDMVRSMTDDAIVFAIANPVPEIMPHLAIEAGAKIVGTGRSDFANQINNVLGFPGIFRGTLDVKATTITKNMKIAAANAIASRVSEEELSPNHIITSPTDPLLMPLEASAVAEAAMQDGVARFSMSKSEVFDLTLKRIEYYNATIAKLVPSRKNPSSVTSSS
ncbi:MAG: NADP-dependent malic enzyme [Candidatus Heimdallarchaeota archaeon]|nr:NADP-dependent malic enzyme [Candidatus Heimdallarchaeota archaeon]MDH5645195.1 NADP-dependent malic enzyme [Candidatus Heimdallarchaeota archaeon]